MEKNYSNDTCCFSGHRHLRGAEAVLREKLRDTIAGLYSRGYRRFICGGAVGFDTLAASAVIDSKLYFPDIKLILFIPCRDQASRWTDDRINEYNRIYRAADGREVLYESYVPGCMQARDRAMVDKSSLCVCFMTHKGGGTAYTVGYAEKQGLEIINLAEEQKSEAFQ